ncbi:unnamed protein product [Ceratitis capitata]|uniref:(Mediterranean fruit fly) hypothetical protein n=1 Tax=Ceratitis capitata TaxID=7213 RepID=A0A811UJP2_CERCA|nr:unnamed protein product [Ceratitis capitata]
MATKQTLLDEQKNLGELFNAWLVKLEGPKSRATECEEAAEATTPKIDYNATQGNHYIKQELEDQISRLEKYDSSTLE